MNRYVELVLYILTMVASGFCGAFALLLGIGMYVEPHNATAENIAWCVAATVAMLAFLAANNALD